MKQSKATEALRVAQDVAAIKSALQKQGYTIRKQPKQAAWKILPPLGKRKTQNQTASDHTEKCYLLTYQPAPISSWILHPQSDNRDCQNILNIIQKTLAKQPTDIDRRTP